MAVAKVTIFILSPLRRQDATNVIIRETVDGIDAFSAVGVNLSAARAPFLVHVYVPGYAGQQSDNGGSNNECNNFDYIVVLTTVLVSIIS